MATTEDYARFGSFVAGVMDAYIEGGRKFSLPVIALIEDAAQTYDINLKEG